MTQLNSPTGLAINASGAIFITNMNGPTVFVVQGGIASLYAGTPGVASWTGDGGSATLATLAQPAHCATAQNGDLYFAEVANCVVRVVYASSKTISTFAGAKSVG